MKFALAFLLCFSVLVANPNEAEFDEFESEFGTTQVFDPLSGYNRIMTNVNDAFYGYLMRPLAMGYDFVMPDTIQGAFCDFFVNLMNPMRLVNNLWQGKFANSWDETKRFLINTTIGFAGLSDAATKHFNIPNPVLGAGNAMINYTDICTLV